MRELQTYSNIVVLTGAGISAESGLKTFRDNDGLWEGHRVEDVATPEAFLRSPETVHRFYNMRRQQLIEEAEPNDAHAALAKFEEQFQGQYLLVTQNVDDLHERAGSKKLIHMHGELRKAWCTYCDGTFIWERELTTDICCPSCKQSGYMRPNIVWFGEIPYQMDEIQTRLLECDLFVSIGTSGNVYPAAGFVQFARSAGADTLELNLEPSLGNQHFLVCEQGKATDLVPQYFKL